MINSMKKQDCGYILLQGIFLISVLFFALFVSSILFIFHISISNVNLLLAVLCSVAVTFYFSGGSIKKIAITTVVGILIMAACMFVCMHVYDWTWDGNAYHKSMVGLLKNSWNPLALSFFDYAALNFPFIEGVAAWYDAYPKGTEIFGACVYSITNNIESGKCFNLLSVVALFCISYAILKATNKLKNWQILCCISAAVLNPVIVIQCFTYYVDGFLGEILLLCLISLIYITFFKKGKYAIACWYFIFVSINIGFNVKFSAIIFFAVLCLTFFCYWLVYAIKENVFLIKALTVVKYSFYLFAFSVLSGLFITGVTSYVINTIRYHNPLYVMIGSNANNGIIENLPVAFRNMSNIESFFISLFSRCSNNKAIENTELKLPMTFNVSDYYQAQLCDTRVAGWGILFSGIFVISMLVLSIYLLKKDVLLERINKLTTVLLMVFFVSVAIIPALCWARFCIPLFWIPCGVLIYIFLNSNNIKSGLCYMTFVAGLIITLLFLNLLPTLDKNYSLIKNYPIVHSQIEKLNSISKNESNNIKIWFNSQYDFYGRIFNLYDYGITRFNYIKYSDVNSNDFSYRIFDDEYSLYYTVTNSNKINNITEFFNFIDDKRDYIICIAAKDEASKALTDEIIKGFRNLGLDFDLREHYRWSYLAVICNGQVVFEELSDKTITCDINIDNNNISLLSAGFDYGNASSIKINGDEFSLNGRGLNIVVYDKQLGYVVDSISVDTFLNNSISRKK